MAKYTELLADYLKNNTLPEVFDEIDGFDDLFTGYYCDYEIGYETEYLFKIKLQTLADIIVPVYKTRIQQVATAMTGVMTPVKTIYTTLNGGVRKNKTTELPIDSTTATPNVVTENDATVDTNNVQESGLTAQDELNRLNELNKKVKIILLELLDQFNVLFMQIY